MTQEDKQLLLKDLCARLPYEPKARKGGWETSINLATLDSFYYGDEIILPYLRPMSSMTEEEEETECYLRTYQARRYADFCNSKHLDYRGLIEKGLALKAPEGMYDNKIQEKRTNNEMMNNCTHSRTVYDAGYRRVCESRKSRKGCEGCDAFAPRERNNETEDGNGVN